MRTFKGCDYSAFISYAHADDEAWFNWVTFFAKELKTGLTARLRGLAVPPLHLSGANGPVNGVLSEQLRQRVAASFAMIIVVHENYALSDWCLKELEYFSSLFGAGGFRDRLYIVALSRRWMEAVEQKPAWKQLCPNPDQIWMPFFSDEDPDKPVDIYLGKEQVSREFQTPFMRLREDLVDKIRKNADGARNPDGPVPAAPARLLFGVASPELANAVSELRASIEQRGLSAEALGTDALLGDFPKFESTDTLVLPLHDGQPLLPSHPGGHLALQHDAWLRRGKPEAQLVWLDMRHVPARTRAGEDHAAFIAARAARAVSRDALLERLSARAPGEDDAVRIYIESNQNERNLWQSLGAQISRRWDEIVAGMQLTRPLHIRPRGLPVDEIDRHPRLEDADGVVLLWGRKEPNALVSQIDKVERKLAGGCDLAPGIVAYLMPPQSNPKQPIPAWGWKVLRFDAERAQDIDVVKEEADDLHDFLRSILVRTSKRRRSSQALTFAA